MFEKVTFKTVTLEKSTIATQGGMSLAEQLGNVACKAVKLKVNKYRNNSAVEQDFQNIFYGDSKQQTVELLQDVNDYNLFSELLYCKNVNEIFVRYITGTDNAIQIQVLIYT